MSLTEMPFFDRSTFVSPNNLKGDQIIPKYEKMTRPNPNPEEDQVISIYQKMP